MRAEDIPQELIDILDKRANRNHSRTGSVVSTLAEILTQYDQLKREPFQRFKRGRYQFYIDLADCWAGVFFGPDATYYCFFTLVLRVAKR